jgi:hypothetical protein
VNRGYNAIYVGVFYDGKVLLPVADNPTSWRSLTAEAVRSGEVAANYDLWAEVIRKGRERGLRVYGTSTFNFGYSNQSFNRDAVLALKATGETISKTSSEPKSNLRVNGRGFDLNAPSDRPVIDPYSLQTKSDFSEAIAALVKRQPDGILFDYSNYLSPQRAGNVKDLGIYGESARQALIAAMPNGTKELMAIYLEAGKITPEAIATLHDNNQQKLGVAQTRSNLNLAAKAAEQILWQLAVNHAQQGISDLIDTAIASINLSSNNLKIGAIFAPVPNLQKLDRKSGISNGRLQPWNRFPYLEQHPMTSAICKDGKCVANEVKKVVNASSKTDMSSKICPVLVGTWGETFRGHPSLEIQMQAIRAVTPQISCVSHFSYSWIEPDSDRQRQAGL